MNKTKIYLHIITMFVIPLMMYQVPQFIRPLLGDWKCKGSVSVVYHKGYGHHYTGCNYAIFDSPSFHDPEWHFGFGHYVLISMGLTLFIVQLKFLMDELNANKDD